MERTPPLYRECGQGLDCSQRRGAYSRLYRVPTRSIVFLAHGGRRITASQLVHGVKVVKNVKARKVEPADAHNDIRCESLTNMPASLSERLRHKSIDELKVDQHQHLDLIAVLVLKKKKKKKNHLRE